MRIRTEVCLPLVIFLLAIANGEKEKESEEEGEGRVFPLIPVFPFLLPYRNVDLAENWNKLKTARNALYFLVRDAITVRAPQTQQKGSAVSDRTPDSWSWV